MMSFTSRLLFMVLSLVALYIAINNNFLHDHCLDSTVGNLPKDGFEDNSNVVNRNAINKFLKFPYRFCINYGNILDKYLKLCTFFNIYQKKLSRKNQIILIFVSYCNIIIP